MGSDTLLGSGDLYHDLIPPATIFLHGHEVFLCYRANISRYVLASTRDRWGIFDFEVILVTQGPGIIS